MTQAIGELLPLAIGVAISPVPVIAVILMLFSGRARANSLSFLLGWLIGIGGGCSVLVVIASTQDLTAGGEPSKIVSWVKIFLGVLLLALAVHQWRSRPAPGAEAPMPSWMRRIDSLRPVASIVMGLLLSIANPKNLLLIVAAALSIAQADLSGGSTSVVVLVFSLLAGCTVLIPTLAYLFAGGRVQPGLGRMKVWLAANDATLMAVLLLVLGVTVVGKGIQGL
ncbi:MAG: GAP family protein [Actinomycetota bacterium]